MTAMVDDQRAVDVLLLPGEFALFHVNMRTLPTLTDPRRIVLVWSFVMLQGMSFKQSQITIAPV